MSACKAVVLAVNLVKIFEGLSLVEYSCPASVKTIGYGHAITNDDDFGGVIDLDTAEALLMRDLAWAFRAVYQAREDLFDWQAAALASLVFNIGQAAWDRSTIRRLIVAGAFEQAAQQFKRWNQAGGVVLPGLVKRRALETKLFRGELNG